MVKTNRTDQTTKVEINPLQQKEDTWKGLAEGITIGTRMSFRTIIMIIVVYVAATMGVGKGALCITTILGTLYALEDLIKTIGNIK